MLIQVARLFSHESIRGLTGNAFLRLDLLSPSRFKKHFPGDPSEESGNNLYGCLKQVPGSLGRCLTWPQMYLLKLAHR